MNRSSHHLHAPRITHPESAAQLAIRACIMTHLDVSDKNKTCVKQVAHTQAHPGRRHSATPTEIPTAPDSQNNRS